MRNYKKFLLEFPKHFTVFLIGLYQKTLSPDHSWLKLRFAHGYCRFYPSCSQYTKEAVARFGVEKGFWLGLYRLLRCHPFAEPKIDPVPKF